MYFYPRFIDNICFPCMECTSLAILWQPSMDPRAAHNISHLSRSSLYPFNNKQPNKDKNFPIRSKCVLIFFMDIGKIRAIAAFCSVCFTHAIINHAALLSWWQDSTCLSSTFVNFSFGPILMYQHSLAQNRLFFACWNFFMVRLGYVWFSKGRQATRNMLFHVWKRRNSMIWTRKDLAKKRFVLRFMASCKQQQR